MYSDFAGREIEDAEMDNMREKGPEGPVEEKEQGQTLEGDKISYYIEDDEVEDIHSYSTHLYSLGYSIYFRMDSPQAARDLFKALKHVKEIEAD